MKPGYVLIKPEDLQRRLSRARTIGSTPGEDHAGDAGFG
jgi:hypothetical protein